ncbi:hypothetical protein BDW74DRAFT_101287 [Aspergillus multicolor]|uniref:uncharacterized protein n=1 Tax=Aspergillus multicolor TaxID=41759 RepID=UPI003CCD2BAE
MVSRTELSYVEDVASLRVRAVSVLDYTTVGEDPPLSCAMALGSSNEGASDRALDPSAGSSAESAYPRSSPVPPVFPGCFMIPFLLKQGFPGWKVTARCQRSCNTVWRHCYLVCLQACCPFLPSHASPLHRHLPDNLYFADATHQRCHLLALSGAVFHSLHPISISLAPDSATTATPLHQGGYGATAQSTLATRCFALMKAFPATNVILSYSPTSRSFPVSQVICHLVCGSRLFAVGVSRPLYGRAPLAIPFSPFCSSFEFVGAWCQVYTRPSASSARSCEGLC